MEGGWTCGSCKGWVPNGVTHFCAGAVTYPTSGHPTTSSSSFAPPPRDPDAQVRIAQALERIAEALERPYE